MGIFSARPARTRWSELRWQPSGAFLSAMLLLTAVFLFFSMATPLGIVVGTAGLAIVIAVAFWLWPMVGLLSLVTIGAIHPFVMLLVFNVTGPSIVLKAVQSWKELVVIIVLAKVIEQTLGQRRAIQINILDVLITIFLLYGTLYLLYPGPTKEDLSIVSRVFGLRADMFFLLAYFIGRGYPITRPKLKALVIGFMAVSLVIAVIAPFQVIAPGITNDIFNAIGFSEYTEFQRGSEGVGFAIRQNEIPGFLISRASSLLLSDLALAFYMLLAVPMAGGLLVVFNGARVRLLAYGLTVATIAAGILTITRTVILAMAPLLLVTFFRPRGLIPGGLVAATLVAGGLIAAMVMDVPLSTVNEIFSSRDSSVQAHFQALQDSVDLLKSEPFGRGLGTAGQTAQRLTPLSGINNESWYFQIATEIGAPALLLWVAITLTLPILAFVRYLKVRDPWLQALSLGIGASMVGYAFAAVTLHAWENLAASIIFWLFAGFAMSGPRLEREWASGKTAKEGQGIA